MCNCIATEKEIVNCIVIAVVSHACVMTENSLSLRFAVEMLHEEAKTNEFVFCVFITCNESSLDRVYVLSCVVCFNLFCPTVVLVSPL